MCCPMLGIQYAQTIVHRLELFLRCSGPVQAGLAGLAPPGFFEGPQGGNTAAPLFILGDFVEAFIGGQSPFEEVAM